MSFNAKLIELLDKNQLSVNPSEIEEMKSRVSKADKALKGKFFLG